MTQGLSLGLSRIRQPRVIAEVIGGVLLGPTVMGRIPGFKDNIIPDAGMPLLALTSNIGLILFLFLVGMEIDASVVKKNARASTLVSVAGLVVPLGLGAALGVGVYRQFIDPSVNEGYFILFTAVAVSLFTFQTNRVALTILITDRHHCVSRSLPDSYRAEIARHDCWCYRFVCWCWQ
jgi:Kef-type K+ transport system membrane component KefB